MREKFKMNFDAEVAKKVGVEEAILFSNIEFWCELNKQSKNNILNGRVWTYNTAASFAKIFPFWSERKIGRMLLKLEDFGYLISCKDFKSAQSHVKWYSVDREEFQVVDTQDVPKLSRVPDKSGNTYKVTDNKTADASYEDMSSKENKPNYEEFLEHVKTVTGKNYKGDKKSRNQFKARVRDGYTMEDFKKAIDAAASTEHHSKHEFKWLTPEFITREDKLEMYRNAPIEKLKLPDVKSSEAKAVHDKLIQRIPELTQEECAWVFDYQHRTSTSYVEYPDNIRLVSRTSNLTKTEADKMR